MRNSTDRFLDKVQEYLKESFSKRAKDCGIPDIAVWDRGWNAALDSMTAYPACLTFVDSKKLIDPYTTQYYLVTGIAVSADDSNSLDELGNIWCDILEDTIRADWHLGGACLDCSFDIDISIGVSQGVFVIWTRILCSVDIGGYVYAR